MKFITLKTIIAAACMLLFLTLSFSIKDAMYSQLLTSISLITGVFGLHCMSTQKLK